jgi:hypothetical protein
MVLISQFKTRIRPCQQGNFSSALKQDTALPSLQHRLDHVRILGGILQGQPSRDLIVAADALMDKAEFVGCRRGQRVQLKSALDGCHNVLPIGFNC